MKLRKKLIVISILIFLPISSLAVYPSQEDYIIVHFAKPDTKIISIPLDKEFSSIEVVSTNFQESKSVKPISVFYPTYQENISLNNSQLIYTQSYNYDILRKGQTENIRINVPSIYYTDNTTKVEMSSITFKINLKQKEISMPLCGYPSQAETIEYVIITNETLWSTFNDNFKDWKIDRDNKINNIWIVNVSDITPISDYWVNGSYGDAINTSNGNHWIPDGLEVNSSYSLFNDTEAKIRNFLRYCYDELNTEYVLLGGNANVVVDRRVRSYASGDGGSTFDNDYHASDMYYACLHYNMNNNTNERWMENKCYDYPWDLVDWGYDLCVGRVLADTVLRLNNWINKTKTYVDNGDFQGNYLKSNIVATKNVDNQITSQQWDMIGDEFPVNFSFVNNQNISQAQWEIMDDYVNGYVSEWDGIHMIIHAGHGGTLYSTYGGTYNPTACNNTELPNFVYTEGCHTADFGEDTSSRMEKWIRNDDCAVAGIANSAYGWFIASTYYVEEMMNQMFDDNNTRIFCKAHDDAREIFGHPVDSVFGMIVKETNFFGDPALEYNWYNSPPEIKRIDGKNKGQNINQSTPTFNWSIAENLSQYTQYNLEIANDSAFTDVIVNITNINPTEYPLHCNIIQNRYMNFILLDAYNLSNYATYYVRVKSYLKVH